MSSEYQDRHDDDETPIGGSPAPAGPPSVLVVVRDECLRMACEDALDDAGCRVRAAGDLADAGSLVLGETWEVLILDETIAAADDWTFVESARRLHPTAHLVIVGETAEVDRLVDAMRHGAADFVQLPCGAEELAERVREAAMRSRTDRRREDRVARLRGICKKLKSVRHQIARRVDELESDLAAVREDVDMQVDAAVVASEFRTLLSQELDVEEMLRTALEALLARTGPTNAAVFLANSDTEYSLGAYVNYDCPRAMADPAIDRLAEDVCEQLAGVDELVRFTDVEEFSRSLGPAGEILQRSDMVAVPCFAHGECLAIMFLFRDRDEPFSDELAALLDQLRGIFAEQLDTIIRVHHRCVTQWPADDSDEEDASDWGSSGGMAA